MRDKDNPDYEEREPSEEVKNFVRESFPIFLGDKDVENIDESTDGESRVSFEEQNRKAVDDKLESQEVAHLGARNGREISGLKKFLRDLAFTVALAFALAILVQSFVMKAFMIPSSSMVPTLNIGDRIMVEKISFYFRSPRYGDIVVFRYPPSEPESMNTKNKLYWPFEQLGETLKLTHRGTSVYVKRVIATGGETIEIRKGLIYINGRRKPEKGIIRDGCDFGPVTVPEGMLFCMGDNRPNSRDSRVWGMVPLRSVIGRVFLILWPPGRWKILR